MNDFLANFRALHIHRWRWWWWCEAGESITERRRWDWVKVPGKSVGRASQRLKLWKINGWDARFIQGSFFRLSLPLSVSFWLQLSFIQLFLFACCACMRCSNLNFVQSYQLRAERERKRQDYFWEFNRNGVKLRRQRTKSRNIGSTTSPSGRVSYSQRCYCYWGDIRIIYTIYRLQITNNSCAPDNYGVCVCVCVSMAEFKILFWCHGWTH